MLRKSRFGLGLRIQVFVAGFAVMSLELLGSRLITPTFGDSISTWGSLIGVVLAGLATGYWYGGRMADRGPTKEKFALIVFAGGILVVMIPFLSPYALVTSLPLGDRYGPLLASLLIVGLPTFVLGMASPYAVRITTQTITSLGNVAGNLYSLSTVGSIAGTFATVFVLIPMWDVRSIIFVLGLGVMIVSVLWLPRLSMAVVVVFALILATTVSTPISLSFGLPGRVIYQKETPYSVLDVVDQGSHRTLFLNGLPHSAMELDNPTTLVYPYTWFFGLGHLLNPGMKGVLFVGGGGFSGPKYFLANYPDVNVDVAEIDPDVIQVAEQYFDVSPGPRLTIFNQDGRPYLAQATKSYDLIILDAYAKTYVPFHLMTAEFLQLVASHLSPDGLVISNLIGTLSGDTSTLVRSEYKTASSIMPNSAIFTTTKSDFYLQNLLLVFSNSPTPLLGDRLLSFRGADPAQLGPLPSDFLEYLHPGSVQTNDVPTLTDNYAPVETMLNPLTGHPFVIEQQVGRLTPTYSAAGTDQVTLGVLVAIAVGWYVYARRRVFAGGRSDVLTSSTVGQP